MNAVEQKLNKHMSDLYEKSKQCQSLIEQYTRQKQEYDDDFFYGQVLYLEKIGKNWEPPKQNER